MQPNHEAVRWMNVPVWWVEESYRRLGCEFFTLLLAVLLLGGGYWDSSLPVGLFMRGGRGEG